MSEKLYCERNSSLFAYRPLCHPFHSKLGQAVWNLDRKGLEVATYHGTIFLLIVHSNKHLKFALASFICFLCLLYQEYSNQGIYYQEHS